MADDGKVAAFIGITAASEATAAFYLESCGGDVERAVQVHCPGVDGRQALDGGSSGLPL